MEDMMNNEVMEVTEEIVNKGGFEKCIKFGVGAVIVSGVSVVTYKYALKPILAKIKAKRAAKNTTTEETEPVTVEFVSDATEE